MGFLPSKWGRSSYTAQAIMIQQVATYGHMRVYPAETVFVFPKHLCWKLTGIYHAYGMELPNGLFLKGC